MPSWETLGKTVSLYLNFFLSVLVSQSFALTAAAIPIPDKSEKTPPNSKVTSRWADTVIGLAYFAIPLELGFFAIRVPSMTIYQKAVLFLFVCFIMFCGLGHLLDASTAPPGLVLWDRYLTAIISAITALASPIVFSYSVDAAVKFQEGRILVDKQKDMLADAQTMTHLGSWEILHDEPAEQDDNIESFLERAGEDAPILGRSSTSTSQNLVISASEEWFRVFGIAITEQDRLTIPLTRYVALLTLEDVNPIQHAISAALTFGTPYTLIQRAHKEDDGKEIYVRGYGKPLYDEQGKITGLRGTAQDITHEVETNQELTAAKEAAMTESKHKDIFLATMSHELRTPLTSIIGHVELMEETPLLEVQQEYIGNAKRAATTLLSLINDLLDYSKLIAGVVELELRPVSLSEVLHDVHAIVRDLGRDVRLKIDAYEGPLIFGDAVRIRQILLNLVSNAIKFTMPGGYVTVTHTHRWPKSEGNDVRGEISFKVRDTGIGMSPETLSNLFQPFRQADASTKRRFGGTGLGLSIVKKLVDAMDGQVLVESQENAGTTFTVILTFDHVNEPPSSSRTASLDRQGKGQMRTLRILVAEDNRVTQRLVQRMLQGHYVDLADNGQLALDMVKANAKYDLMLCDVNMPIMDGLDATRGIRKLQQGKDLYIIGLTANAFKTDRENCLEAGMNDYLSKPFSKQILLNLVHRVADDLKNLPV